MTRTLKQGGGALQSLEAGQEGDSTAELPSCPGSSGRRSPVVLGLGFEEGAPPGRGREAETGLTLPVAW